MKTVRRLHRFSQITEIGGNLRNLRTLLCAKRWEGYGLRRALDLPSREAYSAASW